MLTVERIEESANTGAERPWSLRDMAEDLRKLYNIRGDIDGWIHQLKSHPEQSSVLDASSRQSVGHWCEELCKFFEPHGFNLATSATRLIQQKRSTLTPLEAERRFSDLWDYFLSDCDGRRIELIPPEKFNFYDKGFSHEIGQRFPLATVEIVEAGTCYALGRNTASVFHLMRGVEYGLRTLTHAVRVTEPKIPLNYQEWNCLIDQVKSRADEAIAGWGRGAEATIARQFFNRIVPDLYLFKDDVRNVTMHTRQSYDAPGALSVRNRTAEWFAVLATHVNENSDDQILEKARFAPKA